MGMAGGGSAGTGSWLYSNAPPLKRARVRPVSSRSFSPEGKKIWLATAKTSSSSKGASRGARKAGPARMSLLRRATKSWRARRRAPPGRGPHSPELPPARRRGRAHGGRRARSSRAGGFRPHARRGTAAAARCAPRASREQLPDQLGPHPGGGEELVELFARAAVLAVDAAGGGRLVLVRLLPPR